MSALLLCVIFLALSSLAEAARDPALREHAQARLSESEVDELISRERGRGLDVTDIRWSGALVRGQTRVRYTFPRVLVLVLVLWLVVVPDWHLAIVATAGAAVLTVQGARLAWLTSLLGAADLTIYRTRRAGLVDAVAYSVKGMGAFASLLMVGTGARLLEGGSLWPGITLMVLGQMALPYVHMLPRALIQRTREWAAGERSFGVDADRASVLFLRSFADDVVQLRTPLAPDGPVHPLHVGTRERLEEVVCTAVTRFGRMVAIGRPGERLPELGAERTGLSSFLWSQF